MRRMAAGGWVAGDSDRSVQRDTPPPPRYADREGERDGYPIFALDICTVGVVFAEDFIDRT